MVSRHHCAEADKSREVESDLTETGKGEKGQTKVSWLTGKGGKKSHLSFTRKSTKKEKYTVGFFLLLVQSFHLLPLPEVLNSRIIVAQSEGSLWPKNRLEHTSLVSGIL